MSGEQMNWLSNPINRVWLALVVATLASYTLGEQMAGSAWHAWGVAYPLAEIRTWLAVFAQRFYSFSQFKRSAMPNGPKVSHGGSLSPRGDWRAPSDMAATVWLAEIERDIPPG